jgi:hypothetical protein
MKDNIAPLAITTLIMVFLFIGCTYLYIENNNLKNSNHKLLIELSDQAEEKVDLLNDVEMLKSVLREYEEKHPELGNNSNSYTNNY